jgi:ParB-like chromosome segregation protein Spo0J
MVQNPPTLELVDIAGLVSDPANTRTHDTRNIEAIAASLKRFGQQRPLVITSAGVVIAGNGTLAAAKSLGWFKILVVRTGLTGPDLTAYSIADNRTAELGQWDLALLKDALLDIDSGEFPMEATGWSPAELEAMMTASPPEGATPRDKPKRQCPECGHRW